VDNRVKKSKDQEKVGGRIFSSLMLLHEIKWEVTKLVPIEDLCRGVLSNEKLSLLLGQEKSHIQNIFKKARKDPKYIIAQKFLNNYIINLKSNFNRDCENFIKKIKLYVVVNNPPHNNLGRLGYSHPNLIKNYFKIVDTKEKAYWLGFIYADGSIYRAYKGDEYTRFGIRIARKDKILIERFAKAINFNPKYIKEYDRTKMKDGVEVKYEMIKMEFKSEIFTDYLKELGVVPNKTFRIELPNLGRRELDLAFLLGFFDGDGKQGLTVLRSGNARFLEQIRKKNCLPFEVNPDKDNPKAFSLSLGSILFNEMMLNYELSLPRKRKIFTVNKYKTMKLSKELIRDLVWEMPIFVIARIYDLSQSTLTRLISNFGVKLPPKSYWIYKNYLGKENEKTFDAFFELYKENPNEENNFYYKSFPFNAPSTIRIWLSKARNLLKK
jgi:hypothetical protein